MARRRIRAVAASLVVLAALGGAVLLLPCVEHRVLILNDGGRLNDVRLSLDGRTVWAGVLGDSRGIEILDPIGAGQGEYLLQGRYSETGNRFEAQSGYIANHIGGKQVFLIASDGVKTMRWSEPTSMSRILRMAVDHYGCLDYWLLGRLRGR